jgi:hypothetical protein
MNESQLEAISRSLQAAYPDVADPRSLRPGELLGMLNSTPLGTVITEKRLRKHRETFGNAIGDGKRVDLLRYCAKLMLESIAKMAAPTIKITAGEAATAAYEKKKERERQRSSDRALSGRDIGPAVEAARALVDRDRRADAESKAEIWIRIYLPGWFPLEFSPDQLEFIRAAEVALRTGGRLAAALPRGSGKTTIIAALCIFAIVQGLRVFPVILAATAEAAEELLDGIKTELETNEDLAQDYPEVCLPIQKVAESPNRAKGQVYFGERTFIKWGKRTIVLPNIANSKASGVIVKALPLNGRVRGLNFVRPDGVKARPDFVFLDDPQTDRQAAKDRQVDRLEKLIKGAVLGLAGPKRKIAAIAAVTIIRKTDLADRLTDRQRNPQWNGIRRKMLIAWPTNLELWLEYSEIRRVSCREGREGVDATEFLRKHWDEMHAGAIVAWSERFNEDELSALQNAMNLWCDDAAAFAAEYQNEPQDEEQSERWVLSKDEIAKKVTGLLRGIVPLWSTELVAAIDLQQEVLFWGVIGWGEGFTGQIVEEGGWPEQNSKWFDAAEPPTPLSRLYPDRSIEDRLAIALRELLDRLMSRVYQREGGGEKRIDKVMVDTGFNSDVVHAVVRSTPYASSVFPCKGVGITAAENPMTEWKKEQGVENGWHWQLKPVTKQASRLMLFDTNHWKTTVHQRLATPIGAPRNGSLSLYGATGTDHDMLASHLWAEYPTKTTGKKRDVYIWKMRPGLSENHSLDWTTMSAVGASKGGISLDAIGKAPEKKRKKYTREDFAKRSGR